MFFRKKKAKVEVTKNFLHGVDLDVWDYLGSTEIKFDNVPYELYFFHKKGSVAERKYILVGSNSSRLKIVTEVHSFVYHDCELWRIGEHEIFAVIRKPSKTLKAIAFDDYGYVWSKEKDWWVYASDQDRYNHEVSVHQKKHSKIISEDNNIVKIDFKK